MEVPEEVLLDLNELGKDKKFVGLGDFVVSDDQNLLAYTIDYTGFRQFTLRVKDLRTGQALPDTAERVTSLAWASDNKTLFLVTEDAVTKRSDKLWRHVLGTTKFEEIYNDKDELFDIGVGKTLDERFLLLGSESKDSTEWSVADADLGVDQPFALRTVFARRAYRVRRRAPQGTLLRSHQRHRAQLPARHRRRASARPRRRRRADRGA